MRPRKGWVRVDAGIADDERTRDIVHKSRLPVINTVGWMVWLVGWIKTGGNPRLGTISFTWSAGARKADCSRHDQLRKFVYGAKEAGWLEFTEADGVVHIRVVNYRKWQDPLTEPAVRDHIQSADSLPTTRQQSADSLPTTRQQLDNNSTTEAQQSVDGLSGTEQSAGAESLETDAHECAANAQSMRRVFSGLRPLPDKTRQDNTTEPPLPPEGESPREVTEGESVQSTNGSSKSRDRGKSKRARKESPSKERRGDQRINKFKMFAADKFERKFGAPLVFSHKRDSALIQQMLSIPLELHVLKECYLAFLEQSDEFLEEAGHSIPTFRARLPRILEQRNRPATAGADAWPRYPEIEDD